MDDLKEKCPMRHKNGNCLPAGGFCTANKGICDALQQAYEAGKRDSVKYGYIEPTGGEYVKLDGQCTRCGIPMGSQDNFCPNCGAKMIK